MSQLIKFIAGKGFGFPTIYIYFYYLSSVFNVQHALIWNSVDLFVRYPRKKATPKKLYWALFKNIDGIFSANCLTLNLTRKLNIRYNLRERLNYSFLRKWYAFKSVKRNFRLNFLKYYRLINFDFKTNYINFTINQRLFLSKKTIKKTLWQFFYTAEKHRFLKKKFYKPHNIVDNISSSPQNSRVFFFNANKPLIWKMRNARYAHWDLRTKGKLNEWRYDKLLGTELYMLSHKTNNPLLNFIFIRAYNVILSWRQMILLLKYSLITHNGKIFSNSTTLQVGDIIELPFFLWGSTSFKRRHFKKIIGRAKKLSYKSFLSYKNKKIRKHKVVPKLFKKLPIGFKRFGTSLAQDYALNIFTLVYPLDKYKHDIYYEISNSSVLTLQNWRYRFD